MYIKFNAACFSYMNECCSFLQKEEDIFFVEIQVLIFAEDMGYLSYIILLSFDCAVLIHRKTVIVIKLKCTRSTLSKHEVSKG